MQNVFRIEENSKKNKIKYWRALWFKMVMVEMVRVVINLANGFLSLIYILFIYSGRKYSGKLTL